jgi:hypothetical protein
MPLQFVIHFGIVLAYEAGYFRRIKYFINSWLKDKKLNVVNHNQLLMELEYGDIRKDVDVVSEEERIAELVKSENFENTGRNEIFIVDKLTKYYSNFMAVKGISFALRSTETFGLLGGL